MGNAASQEPARPAATQAEVREMMAKWSDYRGTTPLAGANSRHASDRCNSYLSNANAVLSMLAAAFEDSSTLTSKGMDSEVDNRAGCIVAGALDGVSDLIALASFLLED